MQPRLDLLDDLRRRFTPEPQRGGLSPAVLRRVKDHIEAHLDNNLALETLAALAGLSVHHFARSFRQSAGMSPHRYILQRRIKRASELLTNTDIPLAEIALAVGFSDASHFSRSFLDHVGLAPSEFRRLQR
jgi:transcriptional regulator GlxA family with amidase domain